MLDLSERIIALCKQKKLSQTELAKQIGVSRTIVGNYERGENTPSIETVIKMAKVFDVTVDYFIGEGQLAKYNKALIKRMEEIEKLDQSTGSHLLFLIDSVVQNFKAKKAYAG